MIKVSIAPVAGRHRLTGFLLGAGMICLVVLGTASQAQRFFFLSEYDCVRAAGVSIGFAILSLYFWGVDVDSARSGSVRLFNVIASLLPSALAYMVFPFFVSEGENFADGRVLIVVLPGFIGAIFVYASVVGLIRKGVFLYIKNVRTRRVIGLLNLDHCDSYDAILSRPVIDPKPEAAHKEIEAMELRFRNALRAAGLDVVIRLEGGQWVMCAAEIENFDAKKTDDLIAVGGANEQP